MVCDVFITCSILIWCALKLYQYHNVGHENDKLTGIYFTRRRELMCVQRMVLRYVKTSHITDRSN